jgi:hypothetical protein
MRSRSTPDPSFCVHSSSKCHYFTRSHVTLSRINSSKSKELHGLPSPTELNMPEAPTHHLDTRRDFNECHFLCATVQLKRIRLRNTVSGDMSSNETFNAECLSCVGKGMYWTSHFNDILSGCANPNDNGNCFSRRDDIKCARVQEEEDCDEICSKFAGKVDECSTTRCRLDTQYHCYPVPPEIWVPILCGIVWMVNMISVLIFVQKRGHNPFPKYVLLCLFFGPLVWPYLLCSMNTASVNGGAEAKLKTLACGPTTPHTQDYYGRPPPIGGQPPIFGGHAPPFGYPPPYGQVMQPLLYTIQE